MFSSPSTTTSRRPASFARASAAIIDRRPVESMNSSARRSSTTIAGLCSSTSRSASSMRGALARSSSPETATRTRSSCFSVVTRKGSTRLAYAESAVSLAGGLEPLRHLGPVDDVPPRVDVVRALVLVLEVVGVLPDVDAQQRHQAVAQGRVLVRGARDLHARAVVHEPGPAAAEAVHAGLLELVLEAVEVAAGLLDRRRQVALRLAAAVGAHDLPEEGVVGVPAAVVTHGCLDVRWERPEVLQDLLHGLVRPFGALQGTVGLVHVGLVMLVVMDAHRLLVDVRLERAVVVREIGYLVGHAF